MATKRRWLKAQEYERGYWEGVAQSVAANSYEKIGFYEWRAGQLAERLERLGEKRLLRGDARILEMGSGPVGVLGFLPARQRIAVDPLNGFYAENQKLVELRNPAVEYLALAAEDLAFDDASFDLVIMENCIDHVQDVGAVMAEIQRVLTPGGILYLTVNARSSIGYVVHRVLARAALDPGHPHTFTSRRFRRMILAYDFKLLDFEESSRFQAWVDHLRSPTLRHRAKALLGVAEHLLSALARKPA